MTAQSIVCGSCAAEVPYGRLSCPSCGELLASVAGSRRHGAAVANRTPIPDVLYEPPAAPSAAIAEGQLSLDRSARNGDPARDVDAELPWREATTTDGAGDTFDARLGGQGDAPLAAPVETAASPWGRGLSGSPTPKYMPRPMPRRAAPPAAVEHEPEPEVAEEPELAAQPEATSPPRPTPVASAPAPAAAASAPRPAAPPQPVPHAVASPPAGAAVGPVAAFAAPGAYVPPLPVTVPAGPPAPAREYVGLSGDADDRDRAIRPGRASMVIGGETRDRVLDFTRWLSVAGSAFAAVGFLLPWGLVVIGSSDVSYFGRWGIAGPWHVVVALAVLGNLGLGLVENPVPVWLRTGIAGLGLGALLLGLVWPYITIQALGTGPGAIIAGIGAAALVVSGLLTLVTERHATPSDTV